MQSIPGRLLLRSIPSSRTAIPRTFSLTRRVHIMSSTNTPSTPSASVSESRAMSSTAAVSAASPLPLRAKVPPAQPMNRHDPQDADSAVVLTFFEKVTCTWQYIIYDPKSLEAVIVDSVLDYDPASGSVTTKTADGLLSYIEENGLKIKKILETHAHADHLTAAQYLKQQLGGDVSVGIGQRIGQVQKTFAPVYGYDDPAIFENTFDHYFKDDETFKLGDLSCQVVHLPGHTPDHVGYVIGKAIFTGDSIFNPDVGSARCDFPGGNAQDLFASMQRLLSYPTDYRLFVGHDYPVDRDTLCSTTVGEQRETNKHVKVGTEEASFVDWRRTRDAVLGAPRLLHPSLQVNIRAGKLPPADDKGRVWFKTPAKTELKL